MNPCNPAFLKDWLKQIEQNVEYKQAHDFPRPERDRRVSRQHRQAAALRSAIATYEDLAEALVALKFAVQVLNQDGYDESHHAPELENATAVLVKHGLAQIWSHSAKHLIDQMANLKSESEI